MRSLTALALLTTSCTTPSAVHAGPTDSLDSAWAESSVWDDGQAEVAMYAARRPQYGEIEAYEAVFLVVKEDLDANEHVKADPPYEGKKLLPVLKLNELHSYWTERYPYNYMLSLFVRRSAPSDLIKATLTGQEWCGNTFKQISTRTGKPELIYSSYFDGAGDGRRQLADADLLEDQLPLVLRGLRFKEGLELKRRILPTLITTKVAARDDVIDATISVRARTKLSTDAGDFDAWHVEVRGAGMSQDYWLDAKAPHLMLKMTAKDGRELVLKERMRKPYWDQATVRPSRGQ